MMLTILIVLTILSAAFYRIGGAGKEEIPWAKSFMRDLGCSLCLTAYLLAIGCWHWSLIFAIGLFYASITTYWDFIFKYDNYWVHGFMLGLSLLPMCFFITGIELFPMLFRSIILATTFGALSLIPWPSKLNVWIQECGRGALIILTIPLLFI